MARLVSIRRSLLTDLVAIVLVLGGTLFAPVRRAQEAFSGDRPADDDRTILLIKRV